MKPIETGVTHITPADGNIFLDLGFPPEEAARLLEEADRIIEQKLAAKEALASELVAWMKANSYKQDEAARILGVSRPRVSDIVQKKVQKFSVDSLLDMLARTGKTATIVVS